MNKLIELILMTYTRLFMRRSKYVIPHYDDHPDKITVFDKGSGKIVYLSREEFITLAEKARENYRKSIKE